MSRAVESRKVLRESGELLSALEQTLAELRDFTSELRAELTANPEEDFHA